MSPRTSSSSGDDEPTAEDSSASSDAELPETDFEKAQAEEVHRSEDPEYAAKAEAAEAAKAAEVKDAG